MLLDKLITTTIKPDLFTSLDMYYQENGDQEVTRISYEDTYEDNKSYMLTWPEMVSRCRYRLPQYSHESDESVVDRISEKWTKYKMLRWFFMDNEIDRSYSQFVANSADEIRTNFSHFSHIGGTGQAEIHANNKPRELLSILNAFKQQSLSNGIDSVQVYDYIRRHPDSKLSSKDFVFPEPHRRNGDLRSNIFSELEKSSYDDSFIRYELLIHLRKELRNIVDTAMLRGVLQGQMLGIAYSLRHLWVTGVLANVAGILSGYVKRGISSGEARSISRKKPKEIPANDEIRIESIQTQTGT